jgi:hypothetical protein
VNGIGSQPVSDDAASRTENGKAAGDQGLDTQITDLDRKHMQKFSAHRKAQVMEKIMSLTPVRSVVCDGKNQFEKTILKIHREGYRLIDMQAQETAFTTVWYHKDRSLLGGSADVIMVLWEGSEDGDSTTIMNWKV